MAKRKDKKVKLAAGRPPRIHKAKALLSASATRTIIRSHHQLHKELQKANSAGDSSKARQLQEQIDANGGLQSYQQASILGQSKDRGGDSSHVLMKWLAPMQRELRALSPKPRLLEVGALSTSNACSKSGLFEIERIDLNSQDEGILEQDFMHRPLPLDDDDARFDIISLSLVLNYVPDAAQRGEMLKRTTRFLVRRKAISSSMSDATLPMLFFVLPAPCVANSRYLDSSRLAGIMHSIGYDILQEKSSAKLLYQLWHWTGRSAHVSFPKTEVNPGPGRNNFTIVLNAE